MGLLDSLFNQGTYGGQGQGLLDMLRQSQMQQEQYQPSAGFPGQASPMAVGGYQMPRVGDQAQFTPPPVDPAALPPNAQPAQGQLPMQPQQPAQPQGFGGFLQSLNENFQNMGNGGSIIGALTGQSPNNQTAQFLVSKGIDPATAKSIVSDPHLLRTVLPQLLGTKQTDDIIEHERAQKDPAFAAFLRSKRATTGEYGLNYVYGVDKNGKTVAFAPGKSGDPKQIQFPEGVEIARGIETINTPTEVITRDKQTGVILSREKKDIVGKESAEEVGKARGVAQAALPAAEMTAQRAIDKIDQFMNSKGFNDVFGAIDQFRPNWTMGSDGREALTRFKQLQGTAFLEGRTLLKGGGAITDFESNKAESAIARLERSLNEADAREALNDFKDAVRAGAAKLKATATGAAPAAPAPQPSGGLPSGWSVKVR
jgi:hypothetical protein